MRLEIEEEPDSQLGGVRRPRQAAVHLIIWRRYGVPLVAASATSISTYALYVLAVRRMPLSSVGTFTLAYSLCFLAVGVIDLGVATRAVRAVAHDQSLRAPTLRWMLHRHGRRAPVVLLLVLLALRLLVDATIPTLLATVVLFTGALAWTVVFAAAQSEFRGACVTRAQFVNASVFCSVGILGVLPRVMEGAAAAVGLMGVAFWGASAVIALWNGSLWRRVLAIPAKAPVADEDVVGLTSRALMALSGATIPAMLLPAAAPLVWPAFALADRPAQALASLSNGLAGHMAPSVLKASEVEREAMARGAFLVTVAGALLAGLAAWPVLVVLRPLLGPNALVLTLPVLAFLLLAGVAESSGVVTTAVLSARFQSGRLAIGSGTRLVLTVVGCILSIQQSSPLPAAVGVAVGKASEAIWLFGHALHRTGGGQAVTEPRDEMSRGLA